MTTIDIKYQRDVRLFMPELVQWLANLPLSLMIRKFGWIVPSTLWAYPSRPPPEPRRPRPKPRQCREPAFLSSTPWN